MKKVLFVFVALISMLAMTSCDDKEKCVGTWVSETISEGGFSGNVYLTLRENDHVTLAIKGSGVNEEDGLSAEVAFTIKVDGKWDASLGSLDLELSQDDVRFSIDKFDTGDEEMNALIQLGLSDPETKKELIGELKNDFNVDDLNGSLSINFKDDNTMELTDGSGDTMVLHRK